MHVPFIENELCGRGFSLSDQSDVGFRWAGAGRTGEILAVIGWFLMGRAGLVDGSVSGLVQLSCRAEKRPFTPAA